MKFVAFLRAINSTGRYVKMKSLRQIFESLGFSDVETFLASGNLMLTTTTPDTRALEMKIEAGLQKALGYEVATFIRTQTELAEIAQFTPFKQEDVDASSEFNIIFLKDTLDERLEEKAMALNTDTDKLRVHGSEIYWLRHKKPGTDTFTTPPLERMLGKIFTIRTAQTVKRMAEKV